MFATLYRYPHPHDSTKFIYCGQAIKPERRDRQHRTGKTSFGRRFKKLFPDVELTQPIREVVEAQDQLELNWLETEWMFRYHTWHGYAGGMNLTLGSLDYKNMGLLGGRSRVANMTLEQRQEWGRKAGAASSASFTFEQRQERARKASLVAHASMTSEQRKERSRKAGIKNAESGHLIRIASVGGHALMASMTPEQRSERARKAGLIGSRKGVHVRLHVNRNLLNPQCTFCMAA